jgi:hypothetical protein
VTVLLDKAYTTIIKDYTCSKCTLNRIIREIDKKDFTEVTNEQKEKLHLVKLHIQEMIKNDINESLDKIINELISYCNSKGCTDVLDTISYEPVKADLVRKTNIIKHPKILVIHIQRVFYDEGMTTNKQKIFFPEKLSFEGKNNYELVSFIEHFGYHDFGHYIAYRRFYSQWISLNDSNVTLKSKKNAFEVSNPYMLFYRLI